MRKRPCQTARCIAGVDLHKLRDRRRDRAEESIGRVIQVADGALVLAAHVLRYGGLGLGFGIDDQRRGWLRVLPTGNN